MATKKIVGLRHGKAAPATDTGNKRGDDMGRILNEVGIDQAQARSTTFAGMDFDQVFCSPAQRALRTAEIACGMARDNFIVVPELYTPEGEDGETLDTLFERLGYETPARYLSEDPTGAVSRFEDNAGKALAGHLDMDSEDDQTFVIGGHAVYTPLALAGLVNQMGALDDADKKVVEKLYALNMAEAGAVVVTVTDGVLTDIETLN